MTGGREVPARAYGPTAGFRQLGGGRDNMHKH
jgi:hypothetical protein